MEQQQRITVIGIPQEYHGFSFIIQSIERIGGCTFQAIMHKDGKFYQHHLFIKYAKKQKEFRAKELKNAYKYMTMVTHTVCQMIEDPKKMAKAKKQEKTDAILHAMNLDNTPVVNE
jgi:hypothetical protein